MEIKNLTEAVHEVQALRQELLCGEVGENLGTMSEQHFLLALAAMETAQRHLAIARIQQAEEIKKVDK